MQPLTILILCVEIAAITAGKSDNHGSKLRVKRFSNNSEDFTGKALHSYMKQLYNTRAQGNGNGSFTTSLRGQKIIATSIRGFGTEKSGKNSEEVCFIINIVSVFTLSRTIVTSM